MDLGLSVGRMGATYIYIYIYLFIYGYTSTESTVIKSEMENIKTQMELRVLSSRGLSLVLGRVSINGLYVRGSVVFWADSWEDYVDYEKL